MNETLYIFNLILREELGEYLIDLEICSNLICYFLAITGQHDRLFYTASLKITDGLSTVRLLDI